MDLSSTVNGNSEIEEEFHSQNYSNSMPCWTLCVSLWSDGVHVIPFKDQRRTVMKMSQNDNTNELY